MTLRRLLAVVHAGGSPHHGPNTRWYYLGQALQRRGIEVEVVSSSSFHKYFSPPSVSTPLQQERIDGLTYHWIRTRHYRGRGLGQLANQWDFVRGCLRTAKALANRRPDLVVAVSPHPFTAIAADRIARLADVPLVFEIHDLWPQVLVELGRISAWHPYALALSAAERRAVGRADRVVSLKPGDVEYLVERYCFERSRFTHSPNGVLPVAGHVGDPPDSFLNLRKRYPILVGYVGAISSYYRLERLADLAASFVQRSDIGFVVVGKGDRRDHLAARTHELGLKHLHLVDAVPPATVPAILDRLDIGYVSLADLPLHRFGVSCTKIAEYMRAGLPILGAYRAGYDPVADSGCGLTFPPDDLEGLAGGLRRLASDPNLRSTMATRSKNCFEEVYDIDVVAGKLLEALAPMVESRRIGRSAE